MTADTTTHFTGNIVASSSSSGDSSTASASYTAFDNNTSTYWGTTSTLYSTSGVYTGSTTTTVSSVSKSGEWLQLRIPTASVLRYFSLTGRNDPALYQSRFPSSFIVAGSNDGSTWTTIHITASYNFLLTQGQPTVFMCNQNNTNSYTYFRLIIQSIGCPVNTTYSNICDISEWTLNNGTSNILFHSDNNSTNPLVNSTKTSVEQISNSFNAVPLDYNNFTRLYTGNTGGALYGFTQLANIFTAICTIRNSSTGTTKDFVADLQGNLIDNSTRYLSVNAFLNGATGTIATWYDQSGNGNHATQGSTSLQPVLGIDTAGNFYADSVTSGTIYMTAPSGTLATGNNAYTIFTKHGKITNSSSGTFCGTGAFTTNNGNYLSARGNYLNWWFGNDLSIPGSVQPTVTSGNSVCATYDGTYRYGFVNGIQTIKATAGSMNTTTGTNYIFNANGSGDALNGQIYYLAISHNAIDSTVIAPLHNSLVKKRSNVVLNGNAPLDTISPTSKAACRGAFALTRLSIGYTGPTVQIRRKSDNTTVDFYADIAGNLGTSLNGTGTSYRAWVGLSLGCVTIWYDQSGSGNHATQATNANQPIIQPVNGFTSSCLESFYCVDSQTTGSQFLTLPSNTVPTGTLNAPYTFLLKHGVVNNTTGAFLGAGITSITQGNSLKMGYDFSTLYNNSFYGTGFDLKFGMISGYSPGNQVCCKYDGANVNQYINTTLLQSYTPSHIVTATGAQYLFTGTGNTGNSYLNGQMFYTYIFGISIPESDRINLMTL